MNWYNIIWKWIFKTVKKIYIKQACPFLLQKIIILFSFEIEYILIAAFNLHV